MAVTHLEAVLLVLERLLRNQCQRYYKASGKTGSLPKELKAILSEIRALEKATQWYRDKIAGHKIIR